MVVKVTGGLNLETMTQCPIKTPDGAAAAETDAAGMTPEVTACSYLLQGRWGGAVQDSSSGWPCG